MDLTLQVLVDVTTTDASCWARPPSCLILKGAVIVLPALLLEPFGRSFVAYASDLFSRIHRFQWSSFRLAHAYDAYTLEIWLELF